MLSLIALNWLQEEEDEGYFEQQVLDYFKHYLEKNQAPKWRMIDFPSDHVLFLGCSDSDLTIRFMPQAKALEEERRCSSSSSNGDHSCCIPRPAAAGSTLSIYDRRPFFHAIFWSLPGEKNSVPVKLRWSVSPEKKTETEKLPPPAAEDGVFRVSADEVVLCRPFGDERSEVHILARDAMEFVPMSSLEKAAKALQPLTIHSFVYALD